jgi:hypothetical protein
MSLIKSIRSGKEKRKLYRGSKSFDYSCTNHGSCAYCKRSRLHSTMKRLKVTKYGRDGRRLKGDLLEES